MTESSSIFTLIRPRQDSVPVEIANLATPDVLRRLKKADVALVECSNEWDYLGTPNTVSVVELGPMGLQSYGRSGSAPFDQLKQFRKRSAAGREAVRRFIKELDPRILRAFRTLHSFESDTYNWCVIDPERRPAALVSYPYFARRMIGNQSIELTIARGGSLEDAIVEELSWERSLVRLMAGVPRYWIDISDLQSFLLMTPNHLLPRGFVRWRHWCRIWELTRHGWYGEETRRKLVADTLANPNWVNELQAVAGDDLWAALRSTQDAVHNLLKSVVIPAAIATGAINRKTANTAYQRFRNTDALDRLVRALAGDGGLRPLLALSKVWHGRNGRVVATPGRRQDRFAPDLRLPHLIERPWKAPNGGIVTPLLTPREIENEGEELDHCIGGYVDDAAAGEIFVFHIDLPDGRKGTCTIQEKGSSFVLHDARSVSDRRDADVGEAAAALVKHITDSKLKRQGGEDARNAALIARGVDGLAADPDLSRSVAETNFQAWLPLLPKRLRAPSAAAAIEGPLFSVARKLCRRAWTQERTKKAA